MPSREPRVLVNVAGVVRGMSETLTPGALAQTSRVTELPVSMTWRLMTEAPTPKELLAVMVIWKRPARFGMPLMTPLAALKLSPGGTPMAVKLVPELAAVLVRAKGCPRNA